MRGLIVFALFVCAYSAAFAGDSPQTIAHEYTAGLIAGDDTLGVWGRMDHFGLRVGRVDGDDPGTVSMVQPCHEYPRPQPAPAEVEGDAEFISFQGYFPFPGRGDCQMGDRGGAHRSVSCRLSGFVGAGLSRTEEITGAQIDHAYGLEYNIGAEYVMPSGLVLTGGYDSLVEGFVGIGWGRTFGGRR